MYESGQQVESNNNEHNFFFLPHHYHSKELGHRFDLLIKNMFLVVLEIIYGIMKLIGLTKLLASFFLRKCYHCRPMHFHTPGRTKT